MKSFDEEKYIFYPLFYILLGCITFFMIVVMITFPIPFCIVSILALLFAKILKMK
jgi:hypothetical protein